MKYSINKLARAAGITVRTLHHYDDIGLLQTQRDENGYRLYGDSELLRLQQILIYRDLSFPLPTIKQILDEPSFDYLLALKEHLQHIEKEQLRLSELIKTIKNTLKKLKKGDSMTAQDMYGGLTKKQYEEYTAEAQERWGNTDAYKQSVARVKAMGKAGLAKVGEEMKAIELELAALMDHDITSTEVQEVIAKHRANLTHFYDVSDEMYAGLAHMYIDDPRFAAHYNEVKPGLAKVLSDAILFSINK
jgi:DNA-binding transcriptional MerR regulator